MNTRHVWTGAAACLVLALACCGCGPGGRPGQVTGTVRFRGTALSSGTVTFRGADGRTASAGIAEDGTYRVAGLAPGTATIGVLSHPRVPRGLQGPQPVTTGRIDLPAHYGKPETSGLKCLVEGGRQTFDIDLGAGGR